MAKFILRRALLLLLTMFLVSIAVFLITESSPGNVAKNILGAFITPEQEASFLAQMGCVLLSELCAEVFEPQGSFQFLRKCLLQLMVRFILLNKIPKPKRLRVLPVLLYGLNDQTASRRFPRTTACAKLDKWFHVLDNLYLR